MLLHFEGNNPLVKESYVKARRCYSVQLKHLREYHSIFKGSECALTDKSVRDILLMYQEPHETSAATKDMGAVSNKIDTQVEAASPLRKPAQNQPGSVISHETSAGQELPVGPPTRVSTAIASKSEGTVGKSNPVAASPVSATVQANNTTAVPAPKRQKALRSTTTATAKSDNSITTQTLDILAAQTPNLAVAQLQKRGPTEQQKVVETPVSTVVISETSQPSHGQSQQVHLSGVEQPAKTSSDTVQPSSNGGSAVQPSQDHQRTNQLELQTPQSCNTTTSHAAQTDVLSRPQASDGADRHRSMSEAGTPRLELQGLYETITWRPCILTLLGISLFASRSMIFFLIVALVISCDWKIKIEQQNLANGEVSFSVTFKMPEMYRVVFSQA